MRITKPAYYEDFHCIASLCPDSCCRLWDVEVDADTAALYRSLPGALGQRMQTALYEEDGETYIAMEEGKCPFWRADGLCRIQSELGEQALSQVCTEFPRLHHDYGDFLELGLELSCPEAARIILSADPAPALTEEAPGGEEPGYEEEAMAVLKETRRQAYEILDDRTQPIGKALALLLLWGCHAQELLDGGELPDFDPETAWETALEMGTPGDFRKITEFFAGLEILTPEWADRLAHPEGAGLTEACRPLARYFVGRYWLQAVSDYDLYSRVKFAVASCLLISCLGGDFLRTAQLFSKEIENDADNMDALLDAAYDHPAFTDSHILGFLTEA